MKNLVLIPIQLIVLAALLLVIPARVQAQQDPGFTQYMYNTLAINPAYAGSMDALSFLLLSRHQWMGFEGAPQTQSLALHGPVDARFVGLGFSYSKDRIGSISSDHAYADYAFKIRLNDKSTLSLGLKTGITVRQNDLMSLDPIYDQDPTFSSNDPALVHFNVGAGFYLYSNNYYFGFSVPRLRNVAFVDGSTEFGQQRQETHYYLMGGYVFDVGAEWKIKPSFMSRYVQGSPFSFDVNINTMYNEKVVAGMSHRLGDSFGFMLQLKVFRNLWVGYAYDFTVSPLQNQNTGTHEFMMIFEFFRPEVVKSPRFF